MSKEVTISAAMLRLAQRRARTLGTRLAPEVARLVVEESVVALDPEEGFLLDGLEAHSADDALVQCLGVNDVVVNGRHIDVRPVDPEGEVSVDSSLIGTSYLEGGTLAVQLADARRGRVLGYVTPAQWLAAAEQSPAEQTVSVAPDKRVEELADALAEAIQRRAAEAGIEPKRPEPEELVCFVSARERMSLPRQRQVVEAVLRSPALQAEVGKLARLWSDGTLTRILHSESVWSARVDKIASVMAPRFPTLSRDRIAASVRSAGERAGGQPQDPQFRKDLLSSLAREELASRCRGADLTRLSAVVDRVLDGRRAADAVRDFIKNRVAVELALAIKEGRERVQGFVAASAEEIGMAFQQLALTPVYATHSQDPQAGVETINEALAMLEAGDVAEQMREADRELSQVL